ncbi:hypothetical protein D9757_000680 [Collybiopsis confluens]|uniref:Uncharacterized protein n=1 Tax=Collybiopsis confluens TaxID=2823264 RepID=A0A8H5MG69_9AGAR|nr:hypothetical protein D9757_000680 [Collybiopsis confluens]
MYHNRVVHLIPSNAYYPLAQPLAHKVWIIDCKSCGTFLTNRGMKAVLLLRPNVPLFSSDALPANCSIFTSNPDALKPPPCRPSAHPSRTCDCLTQTLCCRVCGTTIGYMIVIPCFRCTSSISVNNRATNGHRFVFHSSEVIGSERYYVPNEPGVIPFESVPVPVPVPSPPPPNQFQYPAPLHNYLPTPPLDVADLSPVSSSSPSPVAINSPISSPPPLLSYDASPIDSTSIPGNPAFPYGMPTEMVEQPLRSGDLLFWHHLVRHGEIPGVSDDPRARKGHSLVCGR